MLVHMPQASAPPTAVTVAEGESAKEVCSRILCRQHDLHFENRLWHGTHQGCFTGMRLQLVPCAPQVISLTDAIAWQQPRAHAFGVCHHMLADLRTTFHISTLSHEFGATNALHPAAQSLIQGLPAWTGSPLEALALYTDGSYCSNRHSATWAVAVFGRDTQQRWHWCGFRSGALTPQAVQA